MTMRKPTVIAAITRARSSSASTTCAAALASACTVTARSFVQIAKVRTVNSDHSIEGSADLREVSELAEKWRSRAAESDRDGDFCCAVTREHDADDLDALVSRLRAAQVQKGSSDVE
jgi:hypothetical protein